MHRRRPRRRHAQAHRRRSTASTASTRSAAITIHDTHVNDVAHAHADPRVAARTSARSRSASSSASRPSTRRSAASASASRRASRSPARPCGVLRPQGRPWVRRRDGDRELRPGHQRDHAPARHGDGRDRQRRAAARAGAGQAASPTARGDHRPRGGVHVRREAVPPGVAQMVAEMLTAVTEEGGHRRSRRPSPASAWPARRRPRRRSTRPRASTRREKFTAVVRRASCPPSKPRLVIAVVLDEPMIGHYGGDLAGPGVPPRRRGEPALPRRHPRGERRRSSRTSKREGDPADVAARHDEAPPTPPAAPADAAAEARDASAPCRRAAVRVPDATGLAAHDVGRRPLTGLGLVPADRGLGARRPPGAPRRAPPSPKGSAVQLVFEPAS